MISDSLLRWARSRKLARSFCVRLGLAAGLLLAGVVALPVTEAVAQSSASRPLPQHMPCENAVPGAQDAGAAPGLLPSAGSRERAAPTGQGDPSLQFRWAQLATGVRVRYVERGTAGAEPVILLHGYTDSWFSWSPVLPLMPEGYHVFAFDQRGHGCSERPEGAYGMTDLAADVVAFMDAQGLPRATIVGHSMGSLVAQQVALAAPQRVARLVLIASGTVPSRQPSVIELAEAVEGLSDPVPADFVRAFQLSTVHQPLPSEFVDDIVAESMKLPTRVWRALMDGMLAIQPATESGALRIPTLILWGEQDAIFPRSEQDALLSSSPHASFISYPETGHAPHWERPEWFVRDLGRFLRAPTETTQLGSSLCGASTPGASSEGTTGCT